MFYVCQLSVAVTKYTREKCFKGGGGKGSLGFLVSKVSLYGQLNLLLLGCLEAEHHGGWAERGVCSFTAGGSDRQRGRDQRQNVLQTYFPGELLPLSRSHV